MPTRTTITLPDDVAAYIAAHPGSRSAVIAAHVQAQRAAVVDALDNALHLWDPAALAGILETLGGWPPSRTVYPGTVATLCGMEPTGLTGEDARLLVLLARALAAGNPDVRARLGGGS